jgi:hypothetical protein
MCARTGASTVTQAQRADFDPLRKAEMRQILAFANGIDRKHIALYSKYIYL